MDLECDEASFRKSNLWNNKLSSKERHKKRKGPRIVHHQNRFPLPQSRTDGLTEDKYYCSHSKAACGVVSQHICRRERDQVFLRLKCRWKWKREMYDWATWNQSSRLHDNVLGNIDWELIPVERTIIRHIDKYVLSTVCGKDHFAGRS